MADVQAIPDRWRRLPRPTAQYSAAAPRIGGPMPADVRAEAEDGDVWGPEHAAPLYPVNESDEEYIPTITIFGGRVQCFGPGDLGIWEWGSGDLT